MRIVSASFYGRAKPQKFFLFTKWLTVKQHATSLTYKVLTTTQPSYLHNLITGQPPRSTRSSSLVTLTRPSTSSSIRIMGLLQLRYEHDSSTIRARFDCDSATTRYNTLRGFSCARIRDRIRESVVGVSCMLIDSSMHTAFTLYLYRPTPTLDRVCVNMPEIVYYTNAIKCQYAEYTINHCEIIVMLKWKTCGHILRAFA